MKIDVLSLFPETFAGPLDASIIGFIEPLLNPVWVFFIVGEQPSAWALLGGTIIIITVAGHTLNQYRLRPVNIE